MEGGGSIFHGKLTLELLAGGPPFRLRQALEAGCPAADVDGAKHPGAEGGICSWAAAPLQQGQVVDVGVPAAGCSVRRMIRAVVVVVGVPAAGCSERRMIRAVVVVVVVVVVLQRSGGVVNLQVLHPVVVRRVGVELLVVAVVGGGGTVADHGGAIGGGDGPAAGVRLRGGPGGSRGGGPRGGGRGTMLLHQLVSRVGDADAASCVAEAFGVGEQREDAVTAPLHAGTPVEAPVVDVGEAAEVAQGGNVRQEVSWDLVGPVGEQELQHHQSLVHGPPLLPVAGAGHPPPQHARDPPVVVHVEGGVGYAGQGPGVGAHSAVVVGRLLHQQLRRRHVAQGQPCLLVFVLQKPRRLPQQLPPRRHFC